ncbi:MAG TPA: YncE family protein [Mucilaginibacter sp.]|nr:YncE family protein [Mucilaginibacter sp.]
MNLHKKLPALLMLFGTAVSVPALSHAQTADGFHVLRDIKIGSSGGWDYIRADAHLNRVYVSHGNQVNILNAKTGDSVGYIPNTQGVHGIAIVESVGKGYVSCGRANSVLVFDLKTNDTLERIPTGKNPDAIFYDPYSKKVYTCNGRSHDASVIDVATNKVVATIPLGAKPETAVSDEKGKIFVNGEDTHEVIEINANTYKVEHRYNIEEGEEPSGLDIDTKTNRLFIGCGGNKTMVVMDASNGKNLAKFPIGRCDGLVFDPELRLVFVSNGEGFISVIKEVNADKFEDVGKIETEPGARTIGIDLATHHLFLPTAKFGPAPAATAENPRPRPRMEPGTFHVIEVGR